MYRLPDRTTPEGKDYSIQRLLLGTHTEGEPNCLLIAEVKLPNDDAEIDAREFAALNNDPYLNSNNIQEGSYGIRSAKIEIIQQIAHNGEVHRARYMPQNPNVIVTKSPYPELYIFDRSKHSSKPDDINKPTPDLILKGHTKEGM